MISKNNKEFDVIAKLSLNIDLPFLAIYLSNLVLNRLINLELKGLEDYQICEINKIF